MRRRIVSGLFLAALCALLAWAVLTGALSKFLSDSARLFGIENPVNAPAPEDDVLFDDDSTVDWSDLFTDVFEDASLSDSDTAGETEDANGEPKEKFYEFALTSEYFNALLKKYSDGSALKNMSASFSKGRVILSADVSVVLLSQQMEIPAALVVFLPKTVPCTLECIPSVAEGRLRVKVSKVSAGSDVLSPFLGREEVLSTVEEFLNDQLTKYLSSDYKMQSVRVTDRGMYVRFSVK